MGRRLIWTPILLWGLAWAAPGRAEHGGNRVQVEPKNIRIGIFYSGRTVRVKALTPGIHDAVIRVAGPPEPLVLKKKGRKFGFLWMNVGEVRYEAVPALYILRSSRKLAEITTPDVLDQLELGFDALRDQIPAGSDRRARDLFGELVKLKAKDRLFSCEATGVRCPPPGPGRQEVSGRFFLPAKTPIGDYRVDVFGFRRGKPERIGTATIHLQRTSFVSWITWLATKHGLLYGCLAVAVAIVTGLFAGYVFGMGKGASH